jgi:GMP synthase-like glutamine amidotransferase
MKPVLIVRHQDWVQSGHLAETLARAALPHELCAIDQGDSVPADPEPYAGLVFLGGTMSVNDDYAWIDDELNLIATAHGRDVPVLGHCLGSQLCARALGGTVYSMPEKEIGWHSMTPSHGPAVGTWLGDIPTPFEALVWHHDAFTLPNGAELLYVSPFVREQAFAAGNLLATVAHVEVTPALLDLWLHRYGYDLAPTSERVHAIDEVSRAKEDRIAAMHHTVTDPLYARWLQPVRARAEGRRVLAC